MRWRLNKGRTGCEVLLIPKDGRPARAVGVPKLFVTVVVSALIINILVLVGLSSLSGSQRLQLELRASQFAALDVLHSELIVTAREQEQQLHALALEAERLTSRVRELEQLSDEVWTLLGKSPPADDGAELILGQGGPDEGEADVALQAAVTLGQLSKQVPLQLRELQQLRETILSRNHRLDHTPALWPADGYVSSEYGARIHPITGNAQSHNGIDIAAMTGTPVRAPAAGIVTFAGDRGGYGMTVIIDHGYGVQTLYAHNSKLHVRAGQTVKRGDLISSVGTTGVSTGPHLHYEVHVNGKPVNPRTYLP